MTSFCKAIFLCLLVLSGTSCVKRASTGKPVTPYENVMVWNAALAASNRSVLQGVIVLNHSQLLSDASAGKVATMQAKISVDGLTLTKILRQGPTVATGQADEIKLLIDSIKGQVTPLITDGDLGVVDPNTQTKVSDNIKAIGNLADLLVDDLKKAGVLK